MCEFGLTEAGVTNCNPKYRSLCGSSQITVYLEMDVQHYNAAALVLEQIHCQILGFDSFMCQ